MRRNRTQKLIDAFSRLTPEEQHEIVRAIEPVESGPSVESSPAVATEESFLQKRLDELLKRPSALYDQLQITAAKIILRKFIERAGPLIEDLRVKVRTDSDGFYVHLVRENGWKSQEIKIAWDDLN